MTRSTRTGGRNATDAVVPGQFGLSVGRPKLVAPPGFRWVALSDLARLESGHTPSRTQPDYWDGDIPWIGIRDATAHHGKVLIDTNQHVSQAGLDNSSARLLPEGTVCLSRTASVGYVVIMGRPMATSQDFVNWVCTEALLPEFFRYLLMAEQESIRRFAFGSVHQTMYYPDAKALYVCIPRLDEQRAIAAVLGALDDKISANSLLISTADELASSLVRSRVVAGRMTELQQIASVTMGSSPPGTSFNESGTGMAFYQGVRDFGVRTPAERVWTVDPVRFADKDDTLISVRAPVGRVNLAAARCSIGRGLAAVQSTDGRPSTLFHLVQLADWAPFEAEGTVFGSINRRQLMSISLPVLDELNHPETEVAGLEALIAGHLTENRTLTELRDTLLPALMSGRLLVRDGERQVEDAV